MKYYLLVLTLLALFLIAMWYLFPIAVGAGVNLGRQLG